MVLFCGGQPKRFVRSRTRHWVGICDSSPTSFHTASKVVSDPFPGVFQSKRGSGRDLEPNSHQQTVRDPRNVTTEYPVKTSGLLTSLVVCQTTDRVLRRAHRDGRQAHRSRRTCTGIHELHPAGTSGLTCWESDGGLGIGRVRSRGRPYRERVESRTRIYISERYPKTRK